MSLLVSQEFTPASFVSSQRERFAAATSHTVASFITRRVLASTLSLCLTTKVSAAHCTLAWAATMVAAPSTRPAKVRRRWLVVLYVVEHILFCRLSIYGHASMSDIFLFFFFLSCRRKVNALSSLPGGISCWWSMRGCRQWNGHQHSHCLYQPFQCQEGLQSPQSCQRQLVFCLL